MRRSINSRRSFLSKAAIGIGLTSFNINSIGLFNNKIDENITINSKYELLDEILRKKILKQKLFANPVIIESLELKRYKDSFICVVKSKDGAEGISVGHGELKTLWPFFFTKLHPFFINQNAVELDKIIERVFYYQFNFRYNGRSLGVPLATIEFAILDMLGKIANKSMGELIGEIHNPEVEIYMATEFRHLPLDEHFAKIKETVAKHETNALKIKVGYLHAGTTDIHYAGLPGKSEKLIPMVREYYGDDMYLYADSNGYYDSNGAIKIGKLLEEYNYSFFEEPVLYWHFEDIKHVSDNLNIPIANGEQDQSFYNFRWLIANDGIDVVQPDAFYFGGYIRSMKVALMANAFGKLCTPHMSGGDLGYLYDIHFVSAIPNAGAHHETHGLATHVPFECPSSPLTIKDGKIKVPTGPGLGINIDPDFIKKHAAISL